MAKKNLAISSADHDLHTQNTNTLKKSGIRYKGQIVGNKPKTKKQKTKYHRSNRTAALSDADFSALSLSQLPATQWREIVRNVTFELLDKSGKPFLEVAMGKFPVVRNLFVQVKTTKTTWKKEISDLDWEHIRTVLFPGTADPTYSIMSLASVRKKKHTNTRIRLHIHFKDRDDFVHTDSNSAILFSFARLFDNFELLDLFETLLSK